MSLRSSSMKETRAIEPRADLIAERSSGIGHDRPDLAIMMNLSDLQDLVYPLESMECRALADRSRYKRMIYGRTDKPTSSPPLNTMKSVRDRLILFQ